MYILAKETSSSPGGNPQAPLLVSSCEWTGPHNQESLWRTVLLSSRKGREELWLAPESSPGQNVPHRCVRLPSLSECEFRYHSGMSIGKEKTECVTNSTAVLVNLDAVPFSPSVQGAWKSEEKWISYRCKFRNPDSQPQASSSHRGITQDVRVSTEHCEVSSPSRWIERRQAAERFQSPHNQENVRAESLRLPSPPGPKWALHLPKKNAHFGGNSQSSHHDEGYYHSSLDGSFEIPDWFTCNIFL